MNRVKYTIGKRKKNKCFFNSTPVNTGIKVRITITATDSLDRCLLDIGNNVVIYPTIGNILDRLLVGHLLLHLAVVVIARPPFPARQLNGPVAVLGQGNTDDLRQGWFATWDKEYVRLFFIKLKI